MCFIDNILSSTREVIMLKTALQKTLPNTRRCVSSYEFLKIGRPAPNVYNVQLDRPDKRNALTLEMWANIGRCFEELSGTSDCRSIVLSGNGKMFSGGIDFPVSFLSVMPQCTDPAHKSLQILEAVRRLQDSFSAVEKCRKPVICVVHGGCIGGGVDLVSAADIRLMSADAYFQVKEVDIGIAADVGTLQRLPRIVGNQSLVNEYCLTGRKVHSDEAEKVGIVSRVYPDKDSAFENAVALAAQIAGKSPVAVQGTKSNLVYSRDHTVQEGLDRVALWNSAMLLGGDPAVAMSGGKEFEDP